MIHHCHAVECKTPTPPSQLMCTTHWKLVPVPLRMAVVGAYRRGQCQDGRPSRAWVAASARAREHVARLEGHAKMADYLAGVAKVIEEKLAAEASKP